MTKRIQNYQDLVQEKARLKELMQAQRELIRQDFREIKAELQPVRAVLSVAGKFVSKDTSNPLLTAGSNKLIDLLLRKVLLAKAGWLTRIAVPFLVKNYSSHVIGENKDKLMSWITSLFKSKKRSNGVADEEELDDDLVEQSSPLK